MSAERAVRYDPPQPRIRTTEAEVAELRTEAAVLREAVKCLLRRCDGLEKRLDKIESVLGARPKQGDPS